MFLKLESAKDIDKYNPFIILHEESDYENSFFILETEYGAIAISFYSLGVKPEFLIVNGILSICFGTRFFMLNLINQKVLATQKEWFAVMDILFLDKLNYVCVVSELTVSCFNFDGICIWRNQLDKSIIDWSIEDYEIRLQIEDDSTLIVDCVTGNIHC